MTEDLEYQQFVEKKAEKKQFDIEKNLKFIIRHINAFPEQYSSIDSNKITLLFFALSALDILGELDNLFSAKRKQEFIDWIYRLQYTTGKVNGFRGSHGADGSDFDAGNLAQSYSALLCLAILGDDFGRVDRDALLKTVRESQRENGSFWSQGEGSESDMRFVYCAVAICEMLQDRSSIDWTRLSQFIRNSYNPDGGISQGPGDESHGGSTYCAIASLELANRLWDESVLNAKQLERLGRWAVFKQEEGFHGRSHKDDDTCYAFWIGATLKILNMDHYIDRDSLKSFQLKCQHSHIGGFSKINEVGAFPDILHTYFTIASMGVMGEPMVRSVYAPLNTARRTYDYIKKLSFTS